MKASVLVPFSFALLAVASPLGDRTLFKKHHSTPHSRRYLLQSRLESPAACAALLPANTTALPDASNSATPLVNSTTTDNSTFLDPTTADNSTTTDNSTDTSALPTRRRAWKRIAQDDLPDMALTWQRLCLASGGDIFTLQPCVNYAGIDGIDALLANADPCAQQDNADAMITFAKSAGVTNQEALIANAIAYRRHPRNALNILGVIPSTPYCQRAPKNPELTGVVNEQLDGVDPGLFGSPNIPIMPFGAPGTCPFGLTPDLATCTCVNGTDTSSATATADSTDTATLDNSTATDSSINGSVTTTDVRTATTDSAAAKVTATEAFTTSAANTSTTFASSTAAVSTMVSVATPTAKAAAPPAATTAKIAGPNFQPPDISGDVNDING